MIISIAKKPKTCSVARFGTKSKIGLNKAGNDIYINEYRICFESIPPADNEIGINYFFSVEYEIDLYGKYTMTDLHNFNLAHCLHKEDDHIIVGERKARSKKYKIEVYRFIDFYSAVNNANSLPVEDIEIQDECIIIKSIKDIHIRYDLINRLLYEYESIFKPANVLIDNDFTITDKLIKNFHIEYFNNEPHGWKKDKNITFEMIKKILEGRDMKFYKKLIEYIYEYEKLKLSAIQNA